MGRSAIGREIDNHFLPTSFPDPIETEFVAESPKGLNETAQTKLSMDIRRPSSPVSLGPPPFLLVRTSFSGPSDTVVVGMFITGWPKG